MQTPPETQSPQMPDPNQMPAPGPSHSHPGHLKLVFNTGKKFALLRERSFLRKDIPDLFPSTGDPAVAVVRENPMDPSVLGLTNCSKTTWTAAMPDGTPRSVDPSKSIKLVPGMTITFGNQTQARVEPLSSGSAFVSQYGKIMGIGAATVVVLGVLAVAIMNRGSGGSGLTDTQVIANAEKATFFIATRMPRQGDNMSIEQGTGFFITDDGYALTNNHVVEGGDPNEKLQIVINGQQTTGDVVKTDKVLDVALIKVNTPGPTAYLSMGKGLELQKGEHLAAIGYPLGINNSFTDASVSEGVFSGIRNVKTVFPEDDVPGGPNDKLIQTDTAINHGNSGGPLIQMGTGKVVGIDRLINRDDPATHQARVGLDYAIPIEEVYAFLKGTPADGRTH